MTFSSVVSGPTALRNPRYLADHLTIGGRLLLKGSDRQLTDPFSNSVGGVTAGRGKLPGPAAARSRAPGTLATRLVPGRRAAKSPSANRPRVHRAGTPISRGRPIAAPFASSSGQLCRT